MDMKNETSSKFLRAEGLIRNRRYSEALEELRNIDESNLAAEERGYYFILTAEASLYIGDYSAEMLIDGAIEAFRLTADTAKYARAKFLKGWHLFAQGQYAEAKEALLEAYTNHLRCNDLLGAARALNQLSHVTFQLGNIDSSIDSLEKCAGIYRQLSRKSNELVVAMNIAYLHFVAGRLRDSISAYGQVGKHVQKMGEKNSLISYFMSAIPHALKGDIATARKTIAKCKPYLDKYIREKAIYYENLGFIEILDGNHKAAEDALKAGLDISLEIAPESALVSQIKRLFGDLYVAMGKLKQAQDYARGALEVAEKLNERVEIAACHRIFAQIEQSRGHDDKAREWFTKAMDLFDEIGSRYELALTRYLAASSGLFNNGGQVAMLYLARQYFESEDVRHYIDKISALLRKIQPPRKATAKRCAGTPTVIAISKAMKDIVESVEHLAQSDITILLTGETGTGKDLLAGYIHHCSGRKGEFVTVNAAAIPREMIESELFGYSKGAYTGAVGNRRGLFRQAEGGTFYLNEIGDATPELQAKLLEVLDTRNVRRLGEDTDRRVDFRLIAATNHDLQAAMRKGGFRVDLYHRLNDFVVELPPLRERRQEMLALTEHFLTLAGCDMARKGNNGRLEQLGAIFAQRLWPGNVRQLQKEINRLWIVSHGDLGQIVKLAGQSGPATKRDELLEVLQQTGWNRRQAGRILGVSDATIRNRIREYELKAP